MAETIDQVIAELDTIIDWARAHESRIGYFPALYRKVTIEVKKGIAAGRFEDGPRMETLDIIFANRYLDAFHAYQNGQPLSESWAFAFAVAQRNRLIVLQHLLLGMNAHINLDLGVAAAQAAPGDQLAGLRKDFNTINTILSSLVDDVQSELAKVWPGLGLLLFFVRKSDDIVVNFSMKKARDTAWQVAAGLAPTPPEQQGPLISKTDQDALKLAEVISLPGVISATTLMAIRLRERGNVGKIIDLLM